MSQINKILWTFGVISCTAALYYFSPLITVTVVLLSALGYLYFDYERQQGRAVLVHADKLAQHLKFARNWFLNKFINRQQLSDSISNRVLHMSMPTRSTYPANSTNRSMSNSHHDQNSNLNVNENSIRRRGGVGNFHRISSPGIAFQAMSPISREPNTSNDFRNLSISDSRNATLANCRNHSGYLSPLLHDSSHQKISTPGSSSRNVQALGGPLLASTRYNLSSESALFADVNSPGLSSRIARLSEDTRTGSQPATHLVQYAGPGQFPTVHLGPTSRLPVMSQRSTQKTSRAAVRLRMSPRPLPSDALVASDRCRAMSEPPTAQPVRSVLDTLHEISRKRLHAQLGEPAEEAPKKQRTQREAETSKRGRDDSPEREQKKKRACGGNEITSSLSSSRHIVVERAAKRKTSYDDVADGLSAASAGKIAKTAELSPAKTQPPPLADEDHVMREPPPVARKQVERPAATVTNPLALGSRKAPRPRESLEWQRQGFVIAAEDPESAERVRLRDLRAKTELDNKMRLRGMMSIISGATETDGPAPTAPSIAVPPSAVAPAAKPLSKHVTFAENLATVKTFDGASDARTEPAATLAQVSVTASLTNPIVSTGLPVSSTAAKLDGFPTAFGGANAPATTDVVATTSTAPTFTSPASFNVPKTTATTFPSPSTFDVAKTTASTLTFPSTFDVAKTTATALTFPSPSTFNVAKTSAATGTTITSPSTFNALPSTFNASPSTTLGSLLCSASAPAFSAQSAFEVAKATTAFVAPSTFSTATTDSTLKASSGFGAATPFAFSASSAATTTSSGFGVTSASFGTKTSAPITFGDKLTTTVSFGDKSTTPATFGEKSNAPVIFGDKTTTLQQSKPAAPITFGDKASTPSFGSTFGGAPPPYPTTAAQESPAFGFGATNTVAPPPPYAPTAAAGFGFGQSAGAGGFSFGAGKPSGSSFGGTGDNATFGHSKDAPVFGASKDSPFGAASKTEVAVFGAKPDPPAFGSAKPNAFQFGAATTTAGGFGFDGGKPAFGVAANGPVTTTSSAFAFGGPAAAAKPFGFGENGSAFGAAQGGFGSTTTPAAGGFGFGAATAKPATVGGFAFGGVQQAQPTATVAGGFSFGSATAPAPTFGASSAPTFGASSSATSTFGASSIATPTFGATQTATPAFGGTQIVTPTFGSSQTATPTFGASSTPTFGASGGFGGAAPAAGAFQFGAAAAAAPSQGGFNFSGSAQPVSFGGAPQTAFQTGGVAQFGAAPAPGMFSIGTGSSGPRGRQARTRRRC